MGIPINRAPRPLAGRSRELNSGAPDGFQKVQPHTSSRAFKSDPVLYAVIGTWHEGDVIEATVKNCLANGCTKVFVVDNDSPDDTKERAESAGAVIAHNYKTDFYDDDLRLRLMNKVTQEVTEAERLPNHWWLSLDADEFPCGPRGERVLDFLKGVDPFINCVGANAMDLYPTLEPHYVEGLHPADCMDDGLRRASARNVFCYVGHWKHPLLRYSGGDFNMAQSRGSHVPFVKAEKQQLACIPQEPEEELVIFHAPMRSREYTFARLEALCSKQTKLKGQTRCAGDDVHTGGNGSIKRWRSLEYVYAGQWDKVELPHSQIYGNVTGIALFPWRRVLPKVKSFPRWYPDPNTPTVPASKGVSLPMV